MAKNIIDSLKFGSTTGIFTLPYGVCSTAAGVTAKTVSVQGGNFVLEIGARVLVKFSVTNTASSPTLNVSGTGAKNIKYKGSNISGSHLKANNIYEFVYTGNWEFIGDINTDTDTQVTQNLMADSFTAPVPILCGMPNASQSNTGQAFFFTSVMLTPNTKTISCNISGNAATATDVTNDKYHKTGTWSGLTYTASAQGGAEELAFTIPTGTTENTVALGNHSHSNYAESSHTHTALYNATDETCVTTTPNLYSNNLKFQGLRANSTISDGGTLFPSSGNSHLIGLRGGSDSSSGGSHELAFNSSGIFHRVEDTGTNTWGNWTQLMTTDGGTFGGPVTISPGNALKINKLLLPTTSGGSIYGAGSNGYVLKSNGGTVYWGVDGNTYGRTANTSSKIFLMGATTQSSANKTTYSHDTVFVDTNGCVNSYNSSANAAEVVLTTSDLSWSEF